ncbi:hypothetical protein [Leuconostoc lactis]|uniref:hypothetical protein n=1 Tax=Leuconostoc lactis TaxID=1246 RepID=UPI00351EECDB
MINLNKIENQVKSFITSKKMNMFAVGVFFIIIFIQTLLFTSFGRFFPSAAQVLAKAETWLVFFFMIYALFIKATWRKTIFAVIILAIAIYSQMVSGSSTPFTKLLMLLIAVPRTIPSIRTIVKTFGLAMATTFLLTIVLSLLGYLPISGETSRVPFAKYHEVVYCFGFTHPNAFGTLLTAMFMMLYFLYFKKRPKLVISAGIIVVLIDKIITADTALIGAALILLLIFSHSLTKWQIWQGKFGSIAYDLPVVLTLLSIWLAYHNKSALGTFINKLISSRPDVWHAYLTQYPIKMFNATPNIKLDGIHTILGNGVLDGGYIYVLMNWGIVALLLYIIMFSSLIKMSIESNNFQLYSIALVIILMSFPESHMIMFFENVFLILFGFYQYPKNERIQLLRQ